MSAWKKLFVPVLVLKALRDEGFTAPTTIQALGLPSAIRDHLDIIGAAETVSKTNYRLTLLYGDPGCRIDPPWWTINLFLVPANAPQLVKQSP